MTYFMTAVKNLFRLLPYCKTEKLRGRRNKGEPKNILKVLSYGKLVTYRNDGTSLKSVRQIRRTEYPEYNLGNTRTSQINNNGHSSGFQIPFKIWTIFYQPLFDHLKSRPVQISDPHCILLFL